MSKGKFTLEHYSCLAGALLLLQSNAAGQAVYTDIEPDVELQYQGDYFYVDMDNNGTNDFFLIKRSHYFTNTFYELYRFNHVLSCGPNFNPENSIAGIYATNGAGGGTTYFPYALNAGEVINNALSFQYGHYQLMAIGFYEVDETPWDWHSWIGYWTPSKDSLYLGVRFLGADECKHYGWIRCSTVDSAKTLIVHDFAYETKCNTGIVAGDTIGDTASVQTADIRNIQTEIYSFNGQIFVNCPESVQLSVYDNTGRLLLEKYLAGGYNVIDMTETQKGIYLVQILTQSKEFTTKLVL